MLAHRCVAGQRNDAPSGLAHCQAPAQPGSDCQIFVAQLGVVEQLPGSAGKDDLTGIHDDGAVGKAQRRHCVLLDDDRRDTTRLDALDDTFDLLNDNRRQTFIVSEPQIPTWLCQDLYLGNL